MSCEHATTTTLLWLYGEADESHTDHVATCAECQAVAADQADVMTALSGVSHLELGESPVTPEAGAAPANRSFLGAVVTGLALAAAALAIFVGAPAPAPSVAVVEPASPIELAALAVLDEDPLDERFDDVTSELGDLLANVEGGAL